MVLGLQIAWISHLNDSDSRLNRMYSESSCKKQENDKDIFAFIFMIIFSQYLYTYVIFHISCIFCHIGFGCYYYRYCYLQERQIMLA